jgi:twitching motility protein PilT
VPKLDPLFDDLIKRSGTDLHLGVGYPPLARVRGTLVGLRDAAFAADELEDALLELLSAPQRARLESGHELDFGHAHGDAARFRVNYFQKSTGLGAVFRLVPTRVQTLAELSCPEVLWRIADRRAGLVIVSGPACSGKSTTVAAMLDHMNKTRASHILTIEEPIEFVHEPLRAQITQREVGAHASSFAVALRTAARENPDVVFVSELGSAEVMSLALQLATDGVVVIATMQTNGAVATLEAIVGAFAVDEQPQIRSLLGEALGGVVAQQLVPTTDGKGVVAVHEILVGSTAVSAMVREGKGAQLVNLMQAGQTQGMQTMDLGLERLLTQSRISAEDALDRAVDREAFAQVIARFRPDLAERLG